MTHETRILSEAQLRQAVPLDLKCIDVVEAAFVALEGDGVVMPPIMSMDLPDADGEVDVKTAFLPGFDSFAIKVSTGFYGNTAQGLPSLNGLMVVFSAQTGLVEALLLDNGYLTDVRTAAAGAVAARHLAPAQVTCAGVFGTGLQARLQLEAAHLVRPFECALVWGRDPDKAGTCAQDMSGRLGIDVQADSDPARLVAQCQLVITTTPARDPILQAEWLHPGLHITAMGSDAPEKNELAAGVLERADRVVADRISQCVSLGELRSFLASGGDVSDVVDLGGVITGSMPGRRAPDDITICDLTGTGAQDTAIATHALAIAAQTGAVIET
jgi:ectoine utilization protein EutC